jgi:hypothetical protein|nr:MAG TPA: hypothetical protein [Caudoviricetes sp.]
MEFKDLLEIARMLKAEDCRIIRDCLEKLQTLNYTQYADVFLLSENGLDLETAINGVYEGCYNIHENFYEYIDNLLYSTINDLPNFIELDYVSMWYRTFRYDENLYVDWQELKYHENCDEYGTEEQKQKYRDYIEYNLQYSQIIEWYY